MNTDWEPTRHSESRIIQETVCLRDVSAREGLQIALTNLERKINQTIEQLLKEGAKSVEVKITNALHREDNPDGDIATLRFYGYR